MIIHDCGMAIFLGSFAGAALIYVLSALACFGVARLLFMPSPHEPDGRQSGEFVPGAECRVQIVILSTLGPALRRRLL
ncbi:MAG: hypothetical protein ACM338_12250 [Betaproteobacteria bacterium]